MHSQIKVGRIAGIQIGIHYSWFLIAILIVFSLSTYFHGIRSDWSPTTIWLSAAVTGMLFFVALLIHELAHSIVAKSRGLTVREITLFALGGVSQIEAEAPNAKSEFFIAIVGPLTSAIIGVACAGIARWWAGQVTAATLSPPIAVLLWLGYINIGLAIFNLVPGYPLDGGRVLRAILWWITRSIERATLWASRVGQFVAFLFIIFGLYRFFLGANFGGLWIAFIGWFLLDAAKNSSLQVGIETMLRGRRVSDLMQRDCANVPGYLSIRDLVDHYVLHSSSRCFLVMQGEHVLGLVTPDEIRTVKPESWEQTSVQSIMRPLNSLPEVPPDMAAVRALQLMAREHVTQMPVVSAGKLLGIFSQSQLLGFVRLHSRDAPTSDRRAA